MRVAPSPVSASSRAALTLPSAYRSNSPTAVPIVAGSTSSVCGGSGRRWKPRPG